MRSPARPLLALLALLALAAACKSDAPSTPVDDRTWQVPVIPAYDADFEALFDLSRAGTIWLQFTVDEWNALLHDFDRNPRNELCRQATFWYGADRGTAEQVAQVGVRLRGNTWSRLRPELGYGLHDPAATFQRAHFKIKFDEKFDGDESVYGSPSQDVPTVAANDGRSFHGVRSLNLKHNRDDASYLREVYAYELFRRAGVQAPRASFVRLYVQVGDEAPRYLGVMEQIEDVDKDWVKRRHGASGYLFKSLWQQYGPADLASGDADGSASSGRIGMEITDPATPAQGAWWGADAGPYRPAYDLKTKQSEFPQAEAALDGLIALLAGQPTRAELEAAVDVQALLRAMAVNALVGMADDYWRNGNNYYLLQRPDDGRWTFIPYDYDLTFGFQCIGASTYTSPFLGWGDSGGVNPVLMRRVLAIPEFAEDYLRYVGAFTAEGALFDWADLEPRLRALQGVIGPAATGYDARAQSAYSADLSAIQAFVQARVATAAAETAP